ncbi:MAG: hypothetical protein HY010_04265 [Acidobacteria bacterium]|nr:hypothetical protein [Acidobacteriota bacterium]
MNSPLVKLRLSGPFINFTLAILCLYPVTSLAQANFSLQNSPSPNAHGNTLNAVTAISSTDAWAVGFRNDNNLNESRTLIQHWDGLKWKTVPSPNPGSTGTCKGFNTGNLLAAVSAVSSSDVWAVGLMFDCTSLLKPMALHWDGLKWSKVKTPALNTNDNAAFTGVRAFASNDVYAVGYQPATNGAVLTLIEHWDGSSWKVISSPNGNNTGNVLAGISGNSPTDIWAVGDMVAPNTPVKTLVEHFDGANWTIVPSPNPLPTGSLNQNVLSSVQANSATDVTAVGFLSNSGTQTVTTLVEHWDGHQWSVIPSPNPSENAGSFNILRSVSGTSGSNLYAAGFFANGQTGGQQRTMVEHFDGHNWSIIASPTKGIAQQLQSVFAVPNSTSVWSVGAFTFEQTDPETGFLIVPKTLVLFSPTS